MRLARKILRNADLILLSSAAILLIIIPVFAPVFAPNDPIANDYSNTMILFSEKYPLGTDQIGRCILSRLIWGGRSTLMITFSVIVIISAVGGLLGMIAGYFGGRVDAVFTKFTDMMLAIPQMVFVIAIISILGSGTANTIFAMSVVGWTEYYRLMRALLLSQKKLQYVESARLSGFSEIKILNKIIFPNVLPYALVNITQDIGATILTLSGLSLLGLSSKPPFPEWGFMLSKGRKYIQSAPWQIVYPGLAIMIYVIVFNLLGDCLRDILDPRFIKEKNNRRKLKAWLEKN